MTVDKGQYMMAILLVAGLFLSGILFRHVDYIYYVVFITGLFLLIRRYKAEEVILPITVKRYFYITYFFLLTIVISALHYDWNTLFEWRFTSFSLLLFLPLFYIYLDKTNLSEQFFWKLLTVGASFTTLWLVLLIVNWPVIRGQDLLSDPINRGNMAMLFASISLVTFFALKSKFWKFLAVITLVSGLGVSVASGSRGGWLAIVLAFITLMLFFYKTKKTSEFRILLGIATLISLLIAALWQELPIGHRIELAYSNIVQYFDGHVTTSVGYRFEMWKASLIAFMEHPVLGWGWTNFDSAHYAVISSGAVEQIRVFGHPHNQYLLFLVENGLLGLFSLLLFMLYPAGYALYYLKSNANESKAYIAILVVVVTESILEFGLTDDTFSQKYFVFVFSFIMLAALLLLTKPIVKERIK